MSGFNAKEECAFAVVGRDRTVDLEANSEAEREEWIIALTHLVAYLKSLKEAGTKFAQE